METTILISGQAWALWWAAIAASLWWIWSAIWTSYVWQAWTWVVAENPELWGKAMILTALPWSQSLYWLIWWFLVIWKISADMSVGAWFSLFAASLPLALTALFSWIAQWKVAAWGMNIIAKNPDALGSAIIISALVETVAIFWLLITIMALNTI